MSLSRFFLVVFLATFPVPLRAGPPFLTDDPEPVPYQHWEINLGSQYFHDSGGWSGSLVQPDINYGAVENLHLHIQPSLSFAESPGAPTQYEYGTTEIGAKYRFIQETDSIPQVAMYPRVELPSAPANRDGSFDQTHYVFPLWIQKSFGKWTAYGGGGYGINPGLDNHTWWFAGCVIQRQITKDLTLGGEVFHQSPQDPGDKSTTIMNLGGQWNFSDDYHLLFSGGRSVEGPATYDAYIAIQFTFGPEKAKQGH